MDTESNGPTNLIMSEIPQAEEDEDDDNENKQQLKAK